MGEITQLLDQARNGDAAARDQFFSFICAELDRLARSRLRRDDRFTMLDAPGLVHEVYLRMSRGGGRDMLTLNSGIGDRQLAEFLSMSPSTVKRDWHKARAYLLQALEKPA